MPNVGTKLFPNFYIFWNFNMKVNYKISESNWRDFLIFGGLKLPESPETRSFAYIQSTLACKVYHTYLWRDKYHFYVICLFICTSLIYATHIFYIISYVQKSIKSSTFNLPVTTQRNVSTFIQTHRIILTPCRQYLKVCRNTPSSCCTYFVFYSQLCIKDYTHCNTKPRECINLFLIVYLSGSLGNR